MRKVIRNLVPYGLFLALICGAGVWILAQSEEVALQDVFAPFASRLKTHVSGSGIILTWQDSEDVNGNYLVYRLNVQISAANYLSTTLLATVRQGVETYTDYPPDTQEYFYAVLIRKPDGGVYNIFIPFRNITIIGTRVEEIGSPEQLAAEIQNIRAVATAETITVSFTNPRPERELIMYRNDSPLTGYADLIKAVSWVLESGVTSYVDTPPAGIAFYYAVLDSELVKIGKIELNPGKNSTLSSVMLPMPDTQTITTAQEITRSQPIPYLIIKWGVTSDEELPSSSISLPETKQLKPATASAVAKVLKQVPLAEKETMVPVLLEMERVSNPVGEEYLLSNIVKDFLLQRNYANCIVQLINFLSIRRNKELEIRAHFYLGQAFYFSEQYKEAFFEFVLTTDYYFKEANPWLDACLEKLFLSEQ